MVRNERPTTAAFVGQRALDLDELHHRRGHGPCIEAAIGDQVIEIVDGRTETRWPDYLPTLLAAGVLSSLVVPVPAAQQSAGSNVYASTAGAFGGEDRRVLSRFADFAAVALTNMDALQDARQLAEDLRLAMESRAVIEQAKGIVIERHKATPDDAFRLLVGAPQRVNRKLRDLAEDLVLTGGLDNRKSLSWGSP